MEALNLTSRGEVAEQWYDRVAEIYIAEELSRIGDFALADYKWAAVIVVEGEISEYGRYAFYNCSASADTEPVWKLTIAESAQVHASVFSNCRNVPPVPGKEKTGTEEHAEDMEPAVDTGTREGAE